MKIKTPLPPTYFIVCLFLAVVLHYFIPIYQLINFPYRYIGLPLTLLGGILNIWSNWIFKQKKTTIKISQQSSALIIGGPFKFSRHPMYLGMFLTVLGLAIFLGSIISFLPAIIFFFIMDIVFISKEEKMMQKTFGQEYLNYKKQVRKWL